MVERRLERAAEVVEPRLELGAERSLGWTYSELSINLQRHGLDNFIHNDNPALTILAIGISRAGPFKASF